VVNSGQQYVGMDSGEQYVGMDSGVVTINFF
jgi:hypothetical protein